MADIKKYAKKDADMTLDDLLIVETKWNNVTWEVNGNAYKKMNDNQAMFEGKINTMFGIDMAAKDDMSNVASTKKKGGSKVGITKNCFVPRKTGVQELNGELNEDTFKMEFTPAVNGEADYVGFEWKGEDIVVKKSDCSQCKKRASCADGSYHFKDVNSEYLMAHRIGEIMQRKLENRVQAKKLINTELDLPVKTTKIIADFYLSEYALSKRDSWFGDESLMQLMEVAFNEGMTDVTDLVTHYIFLACATEMRHVYDASEFESGGDADETIDCGECPHDGDDCDQMECPTYGDLGMCGDPEFGEMVREAREDYRDFTGITREITGQVSREFIHGMLLQNHVYETKGAQFLCWAKDKFSEIFGANGSMGGDSWGAIARAGYKRMTGQSPFNDPKIFLDHVFSLEHNNGCFFDKNHFFFDLISGKQSVSAVCNAHSRGDLDVLIGYASNDVRDAARIIFKDREEAA